MEKKYDVVVFGATGFTGQFTVDEVARVAEKENLKWAIAGRNMAKLQTVLSESSNRIGKSIEEIAILIADVSSPQSLLEMAQQSKLILNCVGPYRFYGESVVKACIEGKAHHLDICGEPQFLEKMQVLYNSKAKENNIFVIGACGFDSIPAEMGLLYTRRQFKEGEMSNVESFMSFKSGSSGSAINTGTLESALNSFAHQSELKPLRRLMFQDPVPDVEYRLPKRSSLFFSKEVNKWCLPFMGSDRSVANRSMRDEILTGRLEKPYEFRPYITVGSLTMAIGMIVFGLIFAILAKFSLGRSLMMKYPHIFTFGFFKKGGPSRKQIEETSFSMTFIAHGYSDTAKDRAGKVPDKIIKTKLVGPEPGYVTTPICMVQAAVTLLKEKDKFHHKAGVLPAGAVFCDSTLLERLSEHNIKCSTMSE